jgi:hypothetical protein
MAVLSEGRLLPGQSSVLIEGNGRFVAEATTLTNGQALVVLNADRQVYFLPAFGAQIQAPNAVPESARPPVLNSWLEQHAKTGLGKVDDMLVKQTVDGTFDLVTKGNRKSGAKVEFSISYTETPTVEAPTVQQLGGS